MQKTNPKISIIIPVFNAKDYLRETLDCVRAQTYQNLEILLVDDGSSDGSEAICDQYAKNDNRFLVFHIPNGGVASARNFALDRITGEYCMFIDSDDLVKSDYVQAMASAANQFDVALVTCDYMGGRSKTKEMFFACNTCAAPKKKLIHIEDYRYTNKYMHDTAWAALFRAGLIGDLRFDTDLYVGEDTVFFSRLLRKSRSLVYVDEKYYYYTFREDSLAHHHYSSRRYTEILAWERVCKEASHEDPVFLNECYVALALRCRLNYDRAVQAHFSDAAILQALICRCRELRGYVYRSKERTPFEKAKYALFICCPPLFTGAKLCVKKKI